MNTAETIAHTLDRHLEKPAEIVVFGAGALLLDQTFAREMVSRTTNDIDLIIPAARELQFDQDTSFWDAVAKANRELEPQGYYLTHIFSERQVVLTPEWKSHTVRLTGHGFSKLTVTRPRVLDLVISKMGRGDIRDLSDIKSMLLLHHRITGTAITGTEVSAAAARARVPEEYEEIFPKARDRIVALAQELTARIAPPDPRNSPEQGPSMGI